MFRSRLILVVAAALMLSVAGCGNVSAVRPVDTATPPAASALTDTPSPVPTAQPTASPTPAVSPAAMIGPNNYPPDVNPLTGLAVPDPSVLAGRPLLIKISTAPPVVRPQSGIGEADMIFEHTQRAGRPGFRPFSTARV